MSHLNDLREMIGKMERVVIGYSGGVDSTLLAYIATQELGENAVSVLLTSQLVPADQLDEAVNTAQKLGLNLVTISVDPLTSDKVCANPTDRCYFCKKILFGVICDTAKQLGIDNIVDGANMDDTGDFRPGMKAIQELGVISPFKDLGITKEEIRAYARELDLPVWNKPAYACLASRIPYGTRITPELLQQIDRAESVLSRLGFEQFRVRHHGDVARIELVPMEMDKIMPAGIRSHIVREFKKIGYHYVALDLAGYRTGSMNESIGL